MLPGHNRSDDLHAGLPGDARHHVVKLQIHLHQRLLHVLDLCGTELQQTLTLPHVRAQCDNLLPGLKTRAQQAVFMQLLQSLCIVKVCISARKRLRIACVDENHLKAVRTGE